MNTKRKLHSKRKARIRVLIRGTASRPRLAVYRSNKMFVVQVIDDEKAHTLVSKTTKGTTIAAAKLLGAEIARICKTKSIEHVVFDRGGYRYHGAVKQLADAAREGGLLI